MLLYCACAGTNCAGTLVQSLGFCPPQDGYPIGFRPCTLMRFMVATESVLRPLVTLAFGFSFSPFPRWLPNRFKALYSYTFRGSYLECSQTFWVVQFCLVGMLSAQHFITKFAYVKLCRILDSHFKLSHSSSFVKRFSD